MANTLMFDRAFLSSAFLPFWMRSPRDGGPRQGASVNERLSGAMIRAVKRLLPERKVCERYGVTPVTLRRWDQDRRLNFPKRS